MAIQLSMLLSTNDPILLFRVTKAIDFGPRRVFIKNHQLKSSFLAIKLFEIFSEGIFQVFTLMGWIQNPGVRGEISYLN